MTVERIKMEQDKKEEMEKVENWLGDLAEWHKKGLELKYLDEEHFHTCCDVNRCGIQIMEPRAAAELLGFEYEEEYLSDIEYEVKISFAYAGVTFYGLE